MKMSKPEGGHTKSTLRCGRAFPLTRGANVRFGSRADIALARRHVRFTPESGHCGAQLACPLCDDADAAVVDSLKALDPNRPIREADSCTAASLCTTRKVR